MGIEREGGEAGVKRKVKSFPGILNFCSSMCVNLEIVTKAKNEVMRGLKLTSDNLFLGLFA